MKPLSRRLKIDPMLYLREDIKVRIRGYFRSAVHDRLQGRTRSVVSYHSLMRGQLEREAKMISAIGIIGNEIIILWRGLE